MYMHNERGVMLVVALFLSVVLAILSSAIITYSVYEMRLIEREVDRARAYAAAEAGLQVMMNQIGTQNYTGFINSGTYTGSVITPHGVTGSISAALTPESEDYVIIQSTGSGQFTSRNLESRVFLDSNLSKYLVYTNSSSFSSGTGAQYGEPLTDESGAIQYDRTGRERVPQDQVDRALMYFTGDWVTSGTDVKAYSDAYVQDDLIVQNHDSLDVYGDTYVGDEYDIKGTLTVNDTYNDGTDRRVMTTDMQDTLTPLNLNFYRDHASIAPFAANAQSRYLEMTVSADGTHTVVNEYNDRNYTTRISTYDLPATAIVYVNGDAYIKGTIKGRVSVVASDDIFLQGSVEYANGLGHANASDSAAFLSRDLIYFCGNTMTVQGILYGEASGSNNGTVFDASYNTRGQNKPNEKQELILRGNRIMNGSTNLSYYPSRYYLYDPYLKKFRPPGLPVTSAVAFVRET